MGKTRWIETASLMWMPLGLLLFLASAFLVLSFDFAGKQWVGWVLGLGFSASLGLLAWVNITGHIIREWRKGHRAALIYGPIIMFIVAAFVYAAVLAVLSA